MARATGNSSATNGDASPQRSWGIPETLQVLIWPAIGLLLGVLPGVFWVSSNLSTVQERTIAAESRIDNLERGKIDRAHLQDVLTIHQENVTGTRDRLDLLMNNTIRNGTNVDAVAARLEAVEREVRLLRDDLASARESLANLRGRLEEREKAAP